MDDRESSRPVASSAPPPAAATPASAPNPNAPARVENSDEIELPLAAVVATLPLELRAKLVAVPPAGMSVRLQAETVISQLAFGAVKISFGELRQLVPGIFVNSGGELDNRLVSLPLNEILPRLNPAMLARRTVRKIEVAAEISGPFADHGRGFSFTTQPLKASATPPPAPAPPARMVSPVAPRQAAPPPVTPQFPQRSIAPASGNGNGNGHPLPASPLTPRAVTPATNGGNGSNGNGLTLPPGLRLGSMPGNGRVTVPPPTRISGAPGSGPAQPTIFAPLGNLCEDWPEELKNEILGSPLARVNVPLDGAIIMPGLKRGRVVMTWKQLRSLAQPSSSASPKDNLELELPLKVIAPLFLAAQKSSGSARGGNTPQAKPPAKASVSTDIPDLFFGFPQPAASACGVSVPDPSSKPEYSTPQAEPVAPAALVVPPLPKPTEQRISDTNYFVLEDKGELTMAEDAPVRRGENPHTDFMSRQTHPKEVVVRAAALPGVAGSVVAMQDGLRVASQVPAEFNPDTLAAFLPQIFERVNQSTRELRMGALNNINFTVGNVPWKIFRVNSVYFAAFGRAGEQLPSAQLAQLAAEMDRKKQK
jgi:predicted regulator of Ras-like GTPase activity (Roadblock/LC7/MglB family)